MQAAQQKLKRSWPMSSIEMLPLLGMAHSQGPIHGQPGDQASDTVPAFRPVFRRIAAFGRRSILVFALLALWETVPRLGLTDPAFLPPFSDVIAAGWQLAQSGELYDDVAASLLRALSGF
ncbi:MAG: hypothetical protein JO237_10570, partial [Pseudolabrys sp.]|nr:hypothetical protein [Pseudolabrys sp.]